MRCLLCKSAAMEESTSTYFTQMNDRYVIIENVPCRKCTQCGETVYSTSVIEKIDEMLEQIQNISSKIFIMDYTRAA